MQGPFDAVAWKFALSARVLGLIPDQYIKARFEMRPVFVLVEKDFYFQLQTDDFFYDL